MVINYKCSFTILIKGTIYSVDGRNNQDDIEHKTIQIKTE